MKIKEFIKNSIRNITESAVRFPAVVAMLVGVAVTNILLIYNVIDEIYPELIVRFMLACKAGLLLTLADERKMFKVNKIVSSIISVCIAVLSFMVLHFSKLDEYISMGAHGLILAMGMLIMMVLYKDDSEKPLFGYLVQSRLNWSLRWGLATLASSSAYWLSII